MRLRGALARSLIVRPLAILCALIGSLAIAPAAEALQSHALDTAHSPFGHFGTFPIGITVDNSTGDVYVDDLSNTRVLKFNEQGNQLGADFIDGIASLSWNAVDPA